MNTRLLSVGDLLRRFNADGVIKLADADFNAIPGADDVLHVNAVPCTHRAGGLYIMARIAGRDSFWAPLLDVDSAELVTVVATRLVESTSDLSRDDLARLIGQPDSHEELHEILAARYRLTRSIDRWAAGMPLMVSSIRRGQFEREAQVSASREFV